MEHTLTITTTKEKADFFRKFANLNGEQSAELGEHYDNIYCIEGVFDDGHVAEIQLVIADFDNPNWTMGTLYDKNGKNVAECYGEDGNVFGEWFFQLQGSDDTYTVTIEDI